MKTLVVTNMAPFLWGGAEELAVNLCSQLRMHGHESELLRIPFEWNPAARIPSQMLLTRWLELSNVDHVIALKFPAYLVRHPVKTLWVLHQFRQAYDLFTDSGANHYFGKDGDQLRLAIKNADLLAFNESKEIFVNSPVVRDRMLRYNGVDSKVLPPPVNDPERFVGGPMGDYIFAGGRVNLMKRQHLLVEAVARCSHSVRLIIGGPPDSPEDEARVRSAVERMGVSDRVHLDLGMLPRERYADYVNGAAAVAYIPLDEDSLGYVAMEAATASRPIITASDSGGILGLVQDGVTGWIADPDAVDLSRALSECLSDIASAEERGRAARDLWAAMEINWENTIEALLL